MLPGLGFPKAAHLLKSWEYRVCLAHGRRVRCSFGEWCVVNRSAVKAHEAPPSGTIQGTPASASLRTSGGSERRSPGGRVAAAGIASAVGTISGVHAADSRPTCPSARAHTTSPTDRRLPAAAQSLGAASAATGAPPALSESPTARAGEPNYASCGLTGRASVERDGPSRSENKPSRSENNSTKVASERASWRGARLGLVVSKRVGSAPARNRVKRLVREAFRHALPELPEYVDFVFRAGPRAGALDYAAARMSLEHLALTLRGTPPGNRHVNTDSR